MNRLLPLFLFVACTMFVGCRKPTPDTTDGKVASTATTIHLQGDGVRAITNRRDGGAVGIQSGSDMEVPENISSDIDVYPQAKITHVSIIPESTMVGFETADTFEKVAEYYTANMLGNGWLEKPIFEMTNLLMATFTKKERVATIIITANETVTQVSISLTTEAK